MSFSQFYLPDLLPHCPFKDATNPHYARAAAESSAWVDSYSVFTDRKRAYFMQGFSELLVSHAYPFADYDQFRTCCDFVNLLFVLDEISDDQNGEDAAATGQIYLNVMRDPNWDDGSTLAKMTKEFRDRFTKYAGPNCFRRFMKHSEDYIHGVGLEAEYRECGIVLDLEGFQSLRRENSAVRLCFQLFEFVLGIDLPDEVYETPEFMSVYWDACDMVCWSNDVYSYGMERAKGLDGNNIVTVIMKNKSVDIQTASDMVGDHFRNLMTRFIKGKSRLPSWGKYVDEEVASYIRGLEHWVVGNLVWSFESQRYFGPYHLEVKKSLLVKLLPEEED